MIFHKTFTLIPRGINSIKFILDELIKFKNGFKAPPCFGIEEFSNHLEHFIKKMRIICRALIQARRYVPKLILCHSRAVINDNVAKT